MIKLNIQAARLAMVLLMNGSIFAVDTLESEDTLESDPSHTLTHRLVLEHAYAEQASDAMKPPFKGGLYHIQWAYDDKPNEVAGAFWIMGSQHNYPFALLPRAYQHVIYNCNAFAFLLYEVSKRDYEAAKANSKAIVKRFLANPDRDFKWFDELPAMYKERIAAVKERIVIGLNEALGLGPAEAIADINMINPRLIAFGVRHNILFGGIDSKDCMDEVAFKHSDRWAGLETVTQQIDSFFEQELGAGDQDGVRRDILSFFSSSPDQRQAMRELSETDVESFEQRADTRQRNSHWLKNSFSRIFRPRQVGLVMFGWGHEGGRYGVITRLHKAFLRQTPWRGVIVKSMQKFRRF